MGVFCNEGQKRKSGMTITLKIKPLWTINMEPAPRCSCFDDDCKDVTDPYLCWVGGIKEFPGMVVATDIADGYCPMFGKKNNNG